MSFFEQVRPIFDVLPLPFLRLSAKSIERPETTFYGPAAPPPLGRFFNP